MDWIRDLFRRTADFVQEKWPSRSAAAVGSVILASVVLALLGQIQLSSVSPLAWTLVAVAAISPWAIRYYAWRIPKHKKGSIGFGIAISVEKADQARTLRADFVDRLERSLLAQRGLYSFHLIEFAPHISQRVKSKADADDLLFRSRGHFLVMGTARSRIIDGEPRHVLNLDGVVRHGNVRQEVSDKLAGEFREIFPRRLMIAEENDLFSFEFTAKWIDVVARYVVGIAALISGDTDFAEERFLGLSRELESSPADGPPAIAIIRNRLPSRLAEVNKTRLNRLAFHYQMKRDRESLELLEPVLDELAKYDPAYYSAHLMRAICAFALRRDINEARRSLGKCLNVPDPTWRYSIAFLDAYGGDLHGAYEHYKRAFSRECGNPSIAVQSEEFMHLVLEEEPELTHLFFCLGLINERAKGDLASARRDYEQFLAETNEEDFPKEQELVRKWIQNIDKRRATRADEEGKPSA